MGMEVINKSQALWNKVKNTYKYYFEQKKGDCRMESGYSESGT